MKKKRKTFRNFIKDIDHMVFNNPRADRQAGSWDSADDVDKKMLYDKKDV